MNKSNKTNNLEEAKLSDLFSGCGGFSKAFIDEILKEFLSHTDDLSTLDNNRENIKEYNYSNYNHHLSNEDIDKIKNQKSQLIFQNCNIKIINNEQEKKIEKSFVKKAIGLFINIVKVAMFIFEVIKLIMELIIFNKLRITFKVI